MKVLTITSLFPNQEQPFLGQFIKNRIRHVGNLCELKVVAPVPYCPPVKFARNKWYMFTKIPSKECIEGLEVYHPRYFMTPKIGMSLYGLYYFCSIYKFVKRLRSRFQFDIIDAHWSYPDGYASVLIGQKISVPVCVSLRGSDVNEYFNMKLIRRRILKSLEKADGIISVSNAIKNTILGSNVKNDKIAVIMNGIDINEFHYFPIDKARKVVGLSKEKKILLSVGNLIELKGFHIVVDAVRDLVEEGLDIEYYIVGDGPLKENLGNQIRTLGLQGNVFLIGRKNHEELRWWYSAADIFCLCSTNEGCPNVVIEALASGCPVVCMGVGGISEIVDSSDKGVLVWERNAESFGVGIRNALNRDWERERIGHAVSRRTWNQVANETFEFFKSVVGELDERHYLHL